MIDIATLAPGTIRVVAQNAPAGLEVLQIATAGLGDLSYLVSDGTAAAAIDPQRDLDRFEQGLQMLGVPLTRVFETHVHNDYVSGGRALAGRHDATYVLPADAGYKFEHHAVGDGDELGLGGLTIRALRTPGHTPHHTSYAVLDGDQVVMVFSGGCVMVGACGRTDLVSAEMTDQLTRAQYQSARRLLAFPDPTTIGPTHGKGSFCAASAAAAATYTTVEQEKTSNPAALAASEDAFVTNQLAGLLAYPAYYTKMAGFNIEGPGAWEPVTAPALSVEDVDRLREGGAVIVDGRPREQFAAGHIPGSVHIELDSSFSTYLGWLFPFGTEFVLVLDEDADAQAQAGEAVRQSARIGIESIKGRLDGGVGAWQRAGRELTSYEVTDVEGLKQAMDRGGVRVLDVRQDLEWVDGRVPGATHIHIPELPARVQELRGSSEPVYVICRTGHRASMGASLLDGAQIPAVLVDGGFPDWEQRGYPVER